MPVIPQADLLVFSILSCHIMYAWHMEPNSMTKQFHSWISNRGGLDNRQISAVRHLINRDPILMAKEMHSWCKQNKISPWPAPEALAAAEATKTMPALIPCSSFHPLCGHNCYKHAAIRWLLGFRSALPVYTPVHAVPLLLFKRKHLLSQPLRTTADLMWNIALSCSFITSFQAIFWTVFCSSRNTLGRDARINTILAGLAAGLSLLWEKESRRGEIVLFCLARNFDVAFNQIVARGWMTPWNHGSVYVFGLAMALIMMFYQHDEMVFKPSYHKLLARMFGRN